jgi:hypothetical protein
LGEPRILGVPLDLQLTLLSTLLLLAAVVWPMFFDVRRRGRRTGARFSAATQPITAHTLAFAGSSVLTAAGVGLLVVAGLV